MPINLSTSQLLGLRLRAQRLWPVSSESAQGLVSHLCAVQAQEEPSAILALRPRTEGLTAAAVDRARVQDRTIVRTWAMRGTLHLIAAADFGWLIPLFGPPMNRKNKRRYQELGLTEPIRQRAANLLRDILSDGPLLRAEIGERLAGEGIPTEGQAIAHLMGDAALKGLICGGPTVRGKPTYALVEQWLPDADGRVDPDTSLPTLARRYLEAHAPAAPEDLRVWSGLAAVNARAGFEAIKNDLVEVRCLETAYWMLDSQTDWIGEIKQEPVVRLLPNFDEYLLGWRNRDLILSAAYAKRINAGGGIIKAAVLVNGRLAGVWKLKRGKPLQVTVRPFEPLPAGVMPLLEAEARDLARYLGADPQAVDLRIE